MLYPLSYGRIAERYVTISHALTAAVCGYTGLYPDGSREQKPPLHSEKTLSRIHPLQ
ncbi:protein of unknown function [Nitrospira japonica]|uniref:Uncharacterized protein n=1 Tax=Nitrospira japonica TaxID=1325564 RepID=A0A1W1I8A9_9BACT|nr:protein of unknown function [Nitrospira japonica]